MKNYKVFTLVASLIIICIGIFSREMWLSIVTSVCSTVYIITLSAEKRYAFLFGMAYCVTFSYVSFINELYATAIFFFCYLFPVLIASFFRNSSSPERKKPPMHLKEWAAALALAAAVFVVLTIMLLFTDDAQPYLDALNFSICAVTSIMMLLGHKEFWIMNTLACCLSITMWVVQLAANGNGINIILLNIVALISSVFGMLNWAKDLRAGKTAHAPKGVCSPCEEN